MLFRRTVTGRRRSRHERKRDLPLGVLRDIGLVASTMVIRGSFAEELISSLVWLSRLPVGSSAGIRRSWFRQRPGNRDALLLAAGDAARQRGGVVAETHPFGHLGPLAAGGEIRCQRVNGMSGNATLS